MVSNVSRTPTNFCPAHSIQPPNFAALSTRLRAHKFQNFPLPSYPLRQFSPSPVSTFPLFSRPQFPLFSSQTRARRPGLPPRRVLRLTRPSTSPTRSSTRPSRSLWISASSPSSSAPRPATSPSRPPPRSTTLPSSSPTSTPYSPPRSAITPSSSPSRSATFRPGHRQDLRHQELSPRRPAPH